MYTHYIPMEPDQEKLLKWKNDVKAWVDSEFENNPKGALDHLRYRMYVKKDMRPLISNGSWIRNIARTYWEYRNEIVKPSQSELRLLAKLTGGTVQLEHKH